MTSNIVRNAPDDRWDRMGGAVLLGDGEVMRDHPGWLETRFGWLRVIADGKSRSMVMLGHDATVSVRPLGGTVLTPKIDTFQYPPGALAEVPELARALRRVGPLRRCRTPDLWDAIVVAILRGRQIPQHARKAYRCLARDFGKRVRLPDGSTYQLVPTPETILNSRKFPNRSAWLTDRHRSELAAAATSYLQHAPRLRTLRGRELAAALYHHIGGVGQVAARLVVADTRHDWNVYPYIDADLTAAAGHAAPGHYWPRDIVTQRRHWRDLTGEHLSTVTVLTLHWGQNHVPRPAQSTVPRGRPPSGFAITPARRTPTQRDHHGDGRRRW